MFTTSSHIIELIWCCLFQERAWYDNHRYSLAPEPDEAQIFEDIRTGKASNSRPRAKDPGLTTKHILKFLNPTLWKGLDDSDSVGSVAVLTLSRSYCDPQGFYTIYRNLFARLALEEAQHGGDGVDNWPPFGDSTWPWIATNKDDDRAARHFYNAWLSFVTNKDFSWMDSYNPNEAPDRRVKR